MSARCNFFSATKLAGIKWLQIGYDLRIRKAVPAVAQRISGNHPVVLPERGGIINKRISLRVNPAKKLRDYLSRQQATEPAQRSINRFKQRQGNSNSDQFAAGPVNKKLSFSIKKTS